jgi:two-component system KDP operon response regulator KdpE
MSKAKILIVEDDADLRRGLTLRLRANGYDIVHASDGLSAVSAARNERPDLVLLDIGLPCGDGISVLHRYANMAALSAMPVVVLTGRDPRVAEPAVRQFYVAGFLTKPVENDVLLATIERALLGDPDPAVAAAVEPAA